MKKLIVKNLKIFSNILEKEADSADSSSQVVQRKRILLSRLQNIHRYSVKAHCRNFPNIENYLYFAEHRIKHLEKERENYFSFHEELYCSSRIICHHCCDGGPCRVTLMKLIVFAEFCLIPNCFQPPRSGGKPKSGVKTSSCPAKLVGKGNT